MTRVRTRNPTVLVHLVGLVGLLPMAACSTSSSTTSSGADADAAASGVDGATGDGAATDAGLTTDGGGDGGIISSSAAGTELTWLLGLLNGPQDQITETAVAPRFSAAFLQQVPAAALVDTLVGIASSDAPFAARVIESSTAGSPGILGMPARDATLVAIVETGRHLFVRVALAVSAGGAVRIDGLEFTAAPEYDVELRDPTTLGARVSTVAPEARLLIAKLDGDACTPVAALAADQPMPLGSMFKIYVLGALAAKIAAGQADWTDMVAIQDNYKSLPSGVLQDQPAGALFSVQDMASKMISISDNTAADHLLRLVGREAVEANQANMGHANPALNVPFPTTRELFELKLSATPDERAAYIAADAATRRSLLDDDYDQRPLPSLDAALAWTAPIEIDRIEWFASPTDACHGFAALEALGEAASGAPVLDILAINPGLAIDPTTFSYVGYKGGSEPGVLTLGWLLRRAADGAWMTVTLGFADDAQPIDEFVGAYYALAAVQMAGR